MTTVGQIHQSSKTFINFIDSTTRTSSAATTCYIVLYMLHRAMDRVDGIRRVCGLSSVTRQQDQHNQELNRDTSYRKDSPNASMCYSTDQVVLSNVLPVASRMFAE